MGNSSKKSSNGVAINTTSPVFSSYISKLEELKRDGVTLKTRETAKPVEVKKLTRDQILERIEKMRLSEGKTHEANLKVIDVEIARRKAVFDYEQYFKDQYNELLASEIGKSLTEQKRILTTKLRLLVDSGLMDGETCTRYEDELKDVFKGLKENTISVDEFNKVYLVVEAL